jgi:hypothetical protein
MSSYIHTNIFTEACWSIPSHLCMPVYPYVRAYTRRWLQTTAHGAADACLRAHLGIRTCLDAQAPIQTHICTDGHTTPARAHMRTRARAHAPMESTRTHIHVHVLVRRCVHMVIHVSWARACRSRRARARTDAHIIARNLRVHPHAHTFTHTYTNESHLEVARSCCAADPAARAHTHAHSCTSARMNAEMHSEHTQTYVYISAYMCR